MKITAFILLAFCLQVSATTLAQNVTLSEHHAPLEKVINEIKRQTGYSFFYNQDWLQQAQPVNVQVKNAPLETVLKACFADQPFDYAIVNKTIVLKLKEKAVEKKEVAAPITISGKVTDETGQPLPGVTVKQKGTNNGVITDSKGAYSLTVPDNNSIITLSYIGFETQEIAAKDIPNGSVIRLKATATNLREVVVNKGYYNEKRELSTGAVSIVTAKEIGEQPVTDPILALEGRIPGLSISQTSGVPGAYSTILLRGQNSIPNITSTLPTLNDPLYIVDGVPFSSGTLTSVFLSGGALGNSSVNGSSQGAPVQGMSPFNGLNPADIENIEVLKDADATAIYGSRGANGVILITTKKGKAGDTKVDINLSQGIGQVTRQIPLLNTAQYLKMRHQAFANDGATPDPSNDFDVNGTWDTTRNTNWQKLLIGNTAHYSNAQATISGGTTNTQFLIGGGYTRQTTVYPGDYNDQKGMLNINLTHVSANQLFHTQFYAGYVNDNSTLPDVDLTQQITLAPDAPAIYDNNGNLNWQVKNGSSTWYNPLAYTMQHDNAVTNNLISNLMLSYQILPGLELKSSFGFTHDQMNQTLLTPGTFFPPPRSENPLNRGISLATSDNQTWIIEPQLNYHKQIKKGAFDVLVGTTFQNNESKSIASSGSGFGSDALISNPAAASVFHLVGNQYAQYKYNAIYGRLGYSFDDKYLLNITGRRDGSSRFGPDKQFGNFGAIGAGWIFSKEKFLQSLSFLSFGKLRASYGTTGSDQIQNYQYLSTYSSVPSTYQGATGLYPTQLANPNFAWEVVKKLEGGLELGFAQNRINLDLDYYRNRTSNQLVGYSLPYITGFTSVQYNLPAIIQNTGLEISLNTVNVKGSNFSWTSSANISFPNNKLVSYPGLATSPYAYTYTVGKSLFSNPTLYHYTGVNPQTGYYTFATANANGVPSPFTDWSAGPSVTQKYYGGLQNSFTYAHFQLTVFIQFVKQTGYNYFNSFSPQGFFNSNQPTYVLNSWAAPGNITNTEKFFQTGGDALTAWANARGSDYGIGDASFIRLKNISFSYQLPAGWEQQLHLKNARIYFQAQNLLTITGYKGLDPETQGLNLPPLRMMTIGLQASL